MFRKIPFTAIALGIGVSLGVTVASIGPSRAAAPRKVDKETYEKGKKAFKRKQCSGCHVMDDTELGEKGPGLKGIYKKRGEEWLTKWLKDPEAVAKTDPEIIALKKKYPDGMPNPELTDEQLDLILSYLSVDGVEPK